MTTPVQPQHQVAEHSPKAVVDYGDTSGPRVCDDMTVEVALSLMAGAVSITSSCATGTTRGRAWSHWPGSPCSAAAPPTRTGSVYGTFSTDPFAPLGGRPEAPVRADREGGAGLARRRA